jgi:hypothetical protein
MYVVLLAGSQLGSSLIALTPHFVQEDEDVRNILLRECGDLDGYLKAAGVVQVTSLLPPAAAAASAAEDELPGLSYQQGDDGTWVPDATQHGDLLTKMVRGVFYWSLQLQWTLIHALSHHILRLEHWAPSLAKQAIS